jgi:putative ATPase
VLTSVSRDPEATIQQVATPLSMDAIERASQAIRRKYDASGDSHYDTISAFIKSIRGSDADAAVYWLAKMLDGGEDPRFIARRLLILASEDIGLADNQALVLANAAVTAANQLGMPEVRIPLAHVTIYMALAPKSNTAYLAVNEALRLIRSGANARVPEHLKNLDSLDPEVRARVEKYLYPHDYRPPIVQQSYLPDELSSVRFYEPKDSGAESGLIELTEKLRQALGK